MELWDDARLHLEEANKIARDRGMRVEIQRLLDLQPVEDVSTKPRGRKR